MVLLHDRDQLDKIQAVLLGRPQVKTTAVLQASRDLQMDDVSLCTLRSVPGNVGSKMAPRKAWVVASHADGPKLKQNGNGQSLPKPAPTAVGRFRCEEGYMTSEAFRFALKDASRSFRSWLRAAGSHDLAHKCLDTWSVKKVGDAEISGMMRLDATVLPSILKLSGRDCHGQRWFVEPVDGKDQWRTQWRKKLDFESWLVYADRIHNIQGHGTVRD